MLNALIPGTVKGHSIGNTILSELAFGTVSAHMVRANVAEWRAEGLSELAAEIEKRLPG